MTARDKEIPTVLVTGGGTSTALSVLKGLRAQHRCPVRVLLGDCADDIAGRYLADGFVRIPPATDPDFADGLRASAGSVDACLVIPVFDLELPALAAARPAFLAEGIEIAVGSPEAVATCRDKRATHALFERCGVPAPRLWEIEEVEATGSSAFPLFAKPRWGRASLDASRIEDQEQLQRYLARVPEAILQDDVSGPDSIEVTIDVVSDRSGRIQAACPRYRQVVKAGQSYKGLTFRDPVLEGYCARLISELGLAGPACLQCFLTPAGPRFTEINPRFGAATVLSVHAGLNGPLFLLEQALGLEASPLLPRAGVRMLRWWQEVILAPDGTALNTGFE
jgi:carbamoyl-phosphate synthase large subunit